MSFSEYARFCSSIGYNVFETSNSLWIGRSYGFFCRLPLYVMTPPQKKELKDLYAKYHVLGINYATGPGGKGKISHNYFIRDRHYGLRNLNTNCRRNVQKGLNNCLVRRISFTELHRLGLPLNLDTLNRQGRSDQLLSEKDRWEGLCRTGEKLDQLEAWGAFVQGELGAYIITVRLNSIVSVLYCHSRSSLLPAHPSQALYFTLIQKQMQNPGVDAVYNGCEWLTTSSGLDQFKRGMGFIAEPVVLVMQLRPAANYFLLNSRVRHTISSLGPRLLRHELHRRIEAVLEMADLSS